LKEKREERLENAIKSLHEQKLELKEKNQYYKQKDRQRGKLITEIKEALREDVDQKKEISLLKKKD